MPALAPRPVLSSDRRDTPRDSFFVIVSSPNDFLGLGGTLRRPPRAIKRAPRGSARAAGRLTGRGGPYRVRASNFRGFPPESVMKIVNSLKSMKTRHKACRLVRRKGRVYVINKSNPRFKARQG